MIYTLERKEKPLTHAFIRADTLTGPSPYTLQCHGGVGREALFIIFILFILFIFNIDIE